MLDFVCFRWKPDPGYRSQFGPETVNTLRSMLVRNYRKPHRLTCVTDDPAGIDPRVRVLPLWSDFANIPNPMGFRNPSCYRRLKLFSPEARYLIGPRFVALDLDVVITADVAPVFDRPEDFVIWGDTHPQTFYNGGLMLMTAGARPQVWETFDPKASPLRTKRSGAFGSDQAWISYCLGPNEKKWTIKDGVYSWRNHLKRRGGMLPPDARVVLWHGSQDPWREGQGIAWVREHYQ